MTITGTIKGFATPQETHRFAQQAEQKQQVAAGHYRAAVDGLILSSLGMGSYLGEPTSTDDQLMTQAVIESVTSGAVNVIDTAINYRFQCSERAIGEALKHLAGQGVSRDALFIASKNGFLTPDASIGEDFRAYFTREFIERGIVKPNEIAGGMHCMSPAYLENQLDRSLQNLGLETLDLMYLHNGAESQIPAVGKEVFMKRLTDAFAYYEKARAQNKLRYYGMATWTCFRSAPDDGDYLSVADVVAIAEQVGGKSHGFKFIQLPFNLAMPEALTLNTQPVLDGLASTLDATQAFGIGVFTSVPLLQGQLLQHRMPPFEGIQTPAQGCLQFARSTPGIIAPLVGHKQPAHVKDNLHIARIAPMPFEALQAHLATTA